MGMASRGQGNTSPYDGLAEKYDRTRPSYPHESIAHLHAEEGDIVADVGAGTGIFTRQLAAALGKARVVGIEASEDMHREAEQSSVGIANVSFAQGRAEVLPFEDNAVRIVTVATAIHWFDRPAFYAEAVRCLRRDGELLVLQNIRRWWENAFLADYESLHEAAVEDYRRNRYLSGMAAMRKSISTANCVHGRTSGMFRLAISCGLAKCRAMNSSTSACRRPLRSA
jgi:ubiquinone/menaquinone biosynthesis C-methylase UbiE